MSINIKYPKIIELSNGKKILLTDDDWEKRTLVIETDKLESEVRTILKKEGYDDTNLLEFKKLEQLGNGLIKQIDECQIHIRLYSHKNHIQLDAEAELSNKYVEHLSYGWISAFQESWNIINKNFGNVWIYHKGNKRYVKKVISETILTLNDSQSKTDYKLLMASGIFGAIIGAGLFWALNRYAKKDT